jgi:hypothetical protein
MPDGTRVDLKTLRSTRITMLALQTSGYALFLSGIL